MESKCADCAVKKDRPAQVVDVQNSSCFNCVYNQLIAAEAEIKRLEFKAYHPYRQCPFCEARTNTDETNIEYCTAGGCGWDEHKFPRMIGIREKDCEDCAEEEYSLRPTNAASCTDCMDIQFIAAMTEVEWLRKLPRLIREKLTILDAQLEHVPSHVESSIRCDVLAEIRSLVKEKP